MTPELILATIKSGFDFGTELLKFYQTEAGQKSINELITNRAKADEFLKNLFSGALFKG